MFTIANLQTLTGQVKPEGVIVLFSLYLKDEQGEDELALLCNRSIRFMRENIYPLTHLHYYTESTGVFLKITSKAVEIIRHLLASIATSIGLQAPATSADTATPIGTQATLPALDDVVRAAPVIPSYIHDHDQKHVLIQNHDHEMNDTARAAQRAELDRRNIKGQNRASIEADPWCTASVIEAAFKVARQNSDKADCTGLAIWLLLKDKKRSYRDQINTLAAQLSANTSPVSEANGGGQEGVTLSEPETPEQPPPPPVFDESAYTGLKPSQIWQAAQGELQMQMTRATYDTWVKPTSVIGYSDNRLTIAVPNDYTKEWWDTRLMTTVTRILTGIVGQPITVQFTVWRTP